MRIELSIDSPIRATATWDQRWLGNDQGLIACWERGRETAVLDPGLGARAKAGQLVPLPWKGGVDPTGEKKSTKPKYGTLNYLAMWQGLRGDDLDIDLGADAELTCTSTRVVVVFTTDPSKYAES